MRKVLLVVFLTLATSAYAQTYTVERVIDGDTLKLTNGERVRLIGVDKPERRVNDKAKRDSERSGDDVEAITKMGKEATDFARKLVDGKKVRLEFDVQKRDKYGWLLCYVYVDNLYSVEPPYLVTKEGENRFNIFLNATIIKSGHASPMTIPPNVKYADLFKTLYEEARENKRGLWADSEDLKQELPDYDALSEECRQNRTTSGCCFSSVKRMRDAKALLAPGDTLAEANCPEGYQPDMLKCLGSYRWCSPVKGNRE